MPAAWLSQYSLRNGASVPSSCVTWYCSGVSFRLSSSRSGFLLVTAHSFHDGSRSLSHRTRGGLVQFPGPVTGDGIAEDLLAVVTAVLDEDLGDRASGNNAACHVDPRNVRLQRFGVERGAQGVGVELDSHAAEEREIGHEPGEGVDPVGPDPLLVTVDVPDRGPPGIDPHDLGAEPAADLAGPQAVLQVGAEPVLDARLEARAAVDQRDPRSGAVELQRRL